VVPRFVCRVTQSEPARYHVGEDFDRIYCQWILGI
jgi:hypothetical protein